MKRRAADELLWEKSEFEQTEIHLQAGGGGIRGGALINNIEKEKKNKRASGLQG